MPVASQSHAGWISHIYRLIIRHWRLSHFDAMYRCSLALAAVQHAAINEDAGIRLSGPTWAEDAAAAAQEIEAARLKSEYPIQH